MPVFKQLRDTGTKSNECHSKDNWARTKFTDETAFIFGIKSVGQRRKPIRRLPKVLACQQIQDVIARTSDLGADLDFLESLTRNEKKRITDIFNLGNPNADPNNPWTCEVNDLQPWLQIRFEELAKIWKLRAYRIGGTAGNTYPDHTLTCPNWGPACSSVADPIDFGKCWAFEAKLGWTSGKLSKALLQCSRYSEYFFQAESNQNCPYVSIITDGQKYRLLYAHMTATSRPVQGWTNTYEWSRETLHIVGRVFKTFARRGPTPGYQAGGSQDSENFGLDEEKLRVTAFDSAFGGSNLSEHINVPISSIAKDL
ncbi:535_t:CDS:2, partial [Paraglomus occultum]